MPEVVELREVTDRRDVVHRAVQRLTAGDEIVLPSETGPVIAAAACIASAGSAEVRKHGNTALLLRGPEELIDYVPGVSLVGRRIARRCWPGPLLMRVVADADRGLLTALSESSRLALLVDRYITLRVSSHPVLSEIAKLTRGPILLSDASPDARQSVSLIVQETPASASSATVVKLNGSSPGWQLEHIGAINEQRLQHAACELVLFVCTGNTCRSPMAEALCRQMLAARLQCAPEELPKRGYIVASAGLAADYGGPASSESVEVMRRRGIDLRSHTSQPLTERLIEQADRCWTMTRQHCHSILGNHPEAADRIQTLVKGGDISDPIGGSMNDYAACAASIEQNLAQVVEQILGQNQM